MHQPQSLTHWEAALAGTANPQGEGSNTGANTEPAPEELRRSSSAKALERAQVSAAIFFNLTRSDFPLFNRREEVCLSVPGYAKDEEGPAPRGANSLQQGL